LPLSARIHDRNEIGPKRGARRRTNPCLSAKFDPRVGMSLNIKISKHFLAASNPSLKGMPFSQPDSDSQVVLLNKFDQQ
jgi:hypothetical protein